MQSTRHIGLALLIFTALCVVALVVTVISQFTDYAWADTLVDLGETMGRLIFTALTATYITVEGGSMLSEWFKKARLEEGRREGRQLERAEWIAWRDKLDAWERRREEAALSGQPFNEPRPEPPR